MLHLIFQSPLQTATLQRVGNGDALLFLENAVTYLLKNAEKSSALSNRLATNRLFVLISDIETRGINVEELVPGIAVLDYAGWVTLTTEYQRTQSWF
jgi:tRNA 2-thiouridine synthesizing protein B